VVYCLRAEELEKVEDTADKARLVKEKKVKQHEQEKEREKERLAREKAKRKEERLQDVARKAEKAKVQEKRKEKNGWGWFEWIRGKGKPKKTGRWREDLWA